MLCVFSGPRSTLCGSLFPQSIRHDSGYPTRSLASPPYSVFQHSYVFCRFCSAFRDVRTIPHLSHVLTRCAVRPISLYFGIKRKTFSGGEPACTSTAGLLNISAMFGAVNEVEVEEHRPERLAVAASRHLDILPGSGVSPSTIRTALRRLLPLGLRQIHMSGGRWIPGEACYRKDGMGMGVGEGEWAVWRTSEERVREVVEIISTVCDEYALESGSRCV